MSSRDLTNDNENLCVVCFKNVDLYSIGACDHPVCYECSTRMRVLCKQQECPICRGEMPEVIFTREKAKPFKELRPNPNLYDSKYGLQFSSRSIQDAYFLLLDFSCQNCGRQFRNFAQLRDHMRKEHELFYCDLCVDNLKIFAFERRCYNRSELAIHRRKGDEDNKSHRGHPICEFCDQRYMDNDDLFRHLRRDHLYCHFCDADGKHQYYPTYVELRVHFLQDHYLCEEGDCKNEEFTSVFRTDIDLKAHVALVHSKHLSRGATKQARTLEVEFNFKPRPNMDYHHRQNNHRNNHRNQNHTVVQEEEEEGAIGYDEPGGASARHHQRPLTQSDFPTLGSAGEAGVASSRTSVTFTSKMSKPKFNNEEFPSLGGAGPGVGGGGSGGSTVVPRSNITISNKMKKADDFPTLGTPRNITITKTLRNGPTESAGPYRYGKTLAMNAQNFPTLKAESSNGSSMVKLTLNQERAQRSNVSIHVNHNGPGLSSSASIQVRPKSAAEAFPALGGGGSSTSASVVPDTKQWVVPKAKKQQEPKQVKVAKAPMLPPSSLADFPTLGKKSSSVMVPIQDSTASSNKQQESNNNNSNNLNNNTNANNTNKTKDKKEQKKKDKDATTTTTNGSAKEPKSESDNKNATNKMNNKNKHKKSKNDANNSNGTALSSPQSSSSITKTTHPNENCPSAGDARNNGTVKKTSTLKIGTLEQPADGQNKKMPPGITVKPPPGFGFSPALSPSNDLTFTNSSGQSYSILPNNNQPLHVYAQPANFKNRNSNLIRNFVTILKTQECFNEFKSYSDLFRQGTYPAVKFYEHCQAVLGDMFAKLFPELLVLLPDIGKQQELYRVHLEKSKCKNLEECATCKQIIFSYELKHHVNTHYMENHFPSLGSDTAGVNAWRK